MVIKQLSKMKKNYFFLVLIISLSCSNTINYDNENLYLPSGYTWPNIDSQITDSLYLKSFLNGEFSKIRNDTSVIDSDMKMGIKIISFIENNDIDTVKILLSKIIKECSQFSNNYREYQRGILRSNSPYISYAFYIYDYYKYERSDYMNKLLLDELKANKEFNTMSNTLYSFDQYRYIQYEHNHEYMSEIISYFDSLISLHPNFHYLKLLKYEGLHHHNGSFYKQENVLKEILEAKYRKKWCLNEIIKLYSNSEEQKYSDSVIKYTNLYIDNFQIKPYGTKTYNVRKEDLWNPSGLRR